jgi:hypothetical protein
VLVRACSSTPSNVWQDITPASVDLGKGQGLGTLNVVVDALDPATVYVSTDHQGLYKSSDCGATFTKINSGRNGAVLDSGSLWTLAIDPVESNVLYSSPLYGTDVSLFKSRNGGVDWDSLAPKGSNVAAAVQYNFFQALAIDPTDHQHLVVTFHADCNSPYAKVCMAESGDGGASWRIFNGPPLGGWMEDAGPIVVNATTMLYAAWFAPLYYSDDSGATR